MRSLGRNSPNSADAMATVVSARLRARLGSEAKSSASYNTPV